MRSDMGVVMCRGDRGSHSIVSCAQHRRIHIRVMQASNRLADGMPHLITTQWREWAAWISTTRGRPSARAFHWSRSRERAVFSRDTSIRFATVML